jgi:hypothetical protein
MRYRDQLNVPAILRHYALANTPRYLYKHLVVEPSIQALAETMTSQDLVAELREIEQNAERTTEDVAIAYGLLVALSFHDSRLVAEATTSWTPSVLSWGRSLLAMACAPSTINSSNLYRAPSGAIVVPFKVDATATLQK